MNTAVNQIGVVSQEVPMFSDEGEILVDEQAAANAAPNLNPDNLYFDFCTGNGTVKKNRRGVGEEKKGEERKCIIVLKQK